jgi:aminomethyltransferase
VLVVHHGGLALGHGAEESRAIRSPDVAGRYAAVVSASAPVREHLAAARAGTAICARDGLAFVRVSGRDAARLLQNVVTSDIDALSVGDGQYGLALTPKGRPVADAWIVRESDAAFACACETVALDELTAMLRRYRLASRADIAGATGELTLLERPLAAPGRGWHAGPLGALLLGAPEQARAAWDAALDGGAVPIGPETRETLRIERGLPRFGIDFDGSNLPAEAGVVERAISFTKGCYIGQEPIVRLAHRGHANRELRRLQLAGPLVLPATLEEDEREVGRVTSSAGLPEGGAAALGYVRRAVADGAQLVALDASGARVAARDAGRVAAGRP